MDLKTKMTELKKILTEMESILIAFSGGVDSTFLLKVSHDVLGDRVLAVTARSETYPEREYRESVELAQSIGARHLTIETREIDNPGFAGNPPDRCYYCKSELFQRLQKVAQEESLHVVVDGSNADDVGDFRPGLKAACELGVRSPLKEAGLTKEDIREVSHELGLATWDKPAFACLSSRFPYGEEITDEKLAMVGAAEEILHALGCRQVRVRHHGDTARIEVPPEDIPRLASIEVRAKFVARFKEIGYQYITLDLEGYRSGSMNETLSSATIEDTMEANRET